MQKSIITLLCSLGLAICTPAMSSNIDLRSDAPKHYTVKQGDTLWDISKRYLKSPWKWPQLWGYNKQEIKNPHRIYPGQILLLTTDLNGQPRLKIYSANQLVNNTPVDGIDPVIKLSPQTYDESLGYAIPVLPLSVMHNFMDNPTIIPAEEIDAAPFLAHGPDNRVLYSPGDRIYARNITKPGRYLVYRTSRKIYDPDTREFLGQEVIYSGEVATLSSLTGGPKSNPNQSQHSKEVATPMEVLKAASEIQLGDKLLYVSHDQKERYNFIPHEPERPIQGKIASIFYGVSEAAQYQTITINRGENDGLDRGMILTIYRISTISEKAGKDQSHKNLPSIKQISIPAEKIGLAMIYRTDKKLSYALIIESPTNIKVGDMVSNPGLDLENITYTPVKHLR